MGVGAKRIVCKIAVDLGLGRGAVNGLEFGRDQLALLPVDEVQTVAH